MVRTYDWENMIYPRVKRQRERCIARIVSITHYYKFPVLMYYYYIAEKHRLKRNSCEIK